MEASGHPDTLPALSPGSQVQQHGGNQEVKPLPPWLTPKQQIKSKQQHNMVSNSPTPQRLKGHSLSSMPSSPAGPLSMLINAQGDMTWDQHALGHDQSALTVYQVDARAALNAKQGELDCLKAAVDIQRRQAESLAAKQAALAAELKALQEEALKPGPAAALAGARHHRNVPYDMGMEAASLEHLVSIKRDMEAALQELQEGAARLRSDLQQRLSESEERAAASRARAALLRAERAASAEALRELQQQHMQASSNQLNMFIRASDASISLRTRAVIEAAKQEDKLKGRGLMVHVAASGRSRSPHKAGTGSTGAVRRVPAAHSAAVQGNSTSGSAGMGLPGIPGARGGRTGGGASPPVTSSGTSPGARMARCASSSPHPAGMMTTGGVGAGMLSRNHRATSSPPRSISPSKVGSHHQGSHQNHLATSPTATSTTPKLPSLGSPHSSSHATATVNGSPTTANAACRGASRARGAASPVNGCLTSAADATVGGCGLYGDLQCDVSDMEQLAPIKRLMKLQELSARFSRAGLTASHLHEAMAACKALNDLELPHQSMAHMMQLLRTMILADQVFVYRIRGGQFWCIASGQGPLEGSPAAVPRPVERGSVAFSAQSATTLHTADLRKYFAYDHHYEDFKVPHSPATPAVIMPVRDASTPNYPVPGVLPSKLAVKLVGKRLGPGQSHRQPNFTAGDLRVLRVLCDGLGYSVDNWDAWEGVKLEVARRKMMLQRTRELMLQQEPAQLLLDFAQLASDVTDAALGAVYVLDRTRNDFVGHVTMNGEHVKFRRAVGGILGQVFASGEPVCLDDARKEEAFSASIDVPPRCSGLVSMMVVPLRGSSGAGKLAGVMQVINKRPPSGSLLQPQSLQRTAFTQLDLDLLKSVAAAAAGASHFLSKLSSSLDKASGSDPIFYSKTVAEGGRKLAYQMRDALQCENTRLFCLAPDQGLMHMVISAAETYVYPVGCGIAGLAASTGRAQNFNGSRMLASEQHSPVKPQPQKSARGRKPPAPGPGPAAAAAAITTAAASPAASPRTARSIQEYDEEEVPYDEPDEASYDAAVDGAGTSPWCCLAVPCLEAGTQKVVAVLEAVNKRRGRFTQADMRTVRQVGIKAGIVLMSARAYEATDRARRFTDAALQTAQRLLLEAVDMRRLGSIIEDVVQSVMPATPTCALVMLTPNGGFGASAAGYENSGWIKGPVYLPAGTLSDGNNNPPLLERAMQVINSCKELVEVVAPKSAREEASGKVLSSLLMHYVPVRDMRTGMVIGALCREAWSHAPIPEDERALLRFLAHITALVAKGGRLPLFAPQAAVAQQQQAQAPPPPAAAAEAATTASAAATPAAPAEAAVAAPPERAGNTDAATGDAAGNGQEVQAEEQQPQGEEEDGAEQQAGAQSEQADELQADAGEQEQEGQAEEAPADDEQPQQQEEEGGEEVQAQAVEQQQHEEEGGEEVQGVRGGEDCSAGGAGDDDGGDGDGGEAGAVEPGFRVMSHGGGDEE